MQMKTLSGAVRQCLNGCAPPYLSEHCIPVSSADTRRHLRPANRHQLAASCFRLNTYDRQEFSVAGSMAWNSLPDFIQDPTSRRSSTDCLWQPETNTLVSVTLRNWLTDQDWLSHIRRLFKKRLQTVTSHIIIKTRSRRQAGRRMSPLENARTHIQTDVQPENIVLPDPSIGRAEARNIPTVGRWDLHGDDGGGSSADLLSACRDDDASATRPTKTSWNNWNTRLEV